MVYSSAILGFLRISSRICNHKAKLFSISYSPVKSRDLSQWSPFWFTLQSQDIRDVNPYNCRPASRSRLWDVMDKCGDWDLSELIGPVSSRSNRYAVTQNVIRWALSGAYRLFPLDRSQWRNLLYMVTIVHSRSKYDCHTKSNRSIVIEHQHFQCGFV